MYFPDFKRIEKLSALIKAEVSEQTKAFINGINYTFYHNVGSRQQACHTRVCRSTAHSFMLFSEQQPHEAGKSHR